jgi:hypothetical protein
MIRRPQQDATQADNVPGDRKRNDLASTIVEGLEAARPTLLKYERLVVGLTFPGELLAPTHTESMPL